jgi:tetratricopeptide (TPR) repeat protein
VLHALAQKRSLLLILDDLQWIDEASIGLLFHLGRRLEGSRILIAGAYRPDELPRNDSGKLHPLSQLLDEFRRRYGDVSIDLAQADRVGGRALVNALIDSEPNRLDEAFRQALFQQTRGHPLFTVELLRDMQNRGDLFRDQSGKWCQGQALDWKTFPARVEAVIARRMGRLSDALRDILTVASVEGELFTAEVLARVSNSAIRPLLRTLSQQLEREHRLIRTQGEKEVGSHYLSIFRFSHALFQQYIYQQIPAGERRFLHSEVAAALATVYADDLEQVVVQLAHHYTAAADWENAVVYRIQAGDLAYRKASLSDAVQHYQSALAHWSDADAGKKGKVETLYKLGECLWMLGRHDEAIEALEESRDLSRSMGDKTAVATAQRLSAHVYWETGRLAEAGRLFQQALTLLEGERQSEGLAWALAGMSSYHMHLSEYEKAIRLGERALAMARQLDAEVLIIKCLCDLGAALSGKGDWAGLALEQESLERALALNRPHDAGRAYLYFAEGLVYLGRYDQARDVLLEASAYARRMHLPYIAVAASRLLADMEWSTGHWSVALAHVQSMVDRSHEEKMAGLGRLYFGILLARIHNDLGQAETAYRQLTEAVSGATNSLDPRVAFLGELARAEAARGRPKAAAAAASEIVEWTDQARYLFPNIAMALLFICRAPFAFDYLEMAGHARSAWRQLQRLDRQYNTQITSACRLEGEGWLALAEPELSQAVAAFEEAVALWRELGQPYDTIRALSGWGEVLTRQGHHNKATAALEQAMSLIDDLASQLEDPDLKRSFLDSALVRGI